MKQVHSHLRRFLLSAVPLVALLLLPNGAFAKNRVVRHPTNHSRVQRIVRHRRQPVQQRAKRNQEPRIQKKARPKRNRRVVKRIRRAVRRNRGQRRRKSIKRIHFRKRNRPVKRTKRVNRHRKRRARNFRNRYNIFKTAPWRKFKVLNNSTRVNQRIPRMRLMLTFPNVYRGGHWPQSLNVDQKGHYAYIGFDSFANDGSKVLRYNLYRHHFNGVGRTFSGGHAQAVSADPHSNLWFVDRTSDDEGGDHEGPVNKGSFVEVSPKSLKPVYRKFFKFGNNYMGDNLAFAGKYGIFNVSRIWGRNHTSNHYRRGMLVIYHTNQLDRHGSQWSQIGALRHTPGEFTIQVASYNPRTQRLYVGSSDPTDIISMPVQKILKHSLRKRDVHVAHLSLGYRREIEGLSFDHKGYMYLLLGSPGQLLRSRRPVTK